MLLSVIVPIRNEIRYIKESFISIMESISSIESEVFFIDGKSTDGTYEWLTDAVKKHKNCHVRINNNKTVSKSFNSVFDQTKGLYISRIDGHTIYPKTYFKDSIRILKIKKVDVVGGPAKHIGKNWKGKTIANCMMSIFGVGNSKFRISKRESYVDTIPFPVYKRSVLNDVGLYDEELIKNQDDELNYRCISKGYKILMSPKLMTKYIVRDNLSDLWKQYFFYGYYKPLVFKKVKQSFKLYQFIPIIHISFSILAIILSCVNLYYSSYFFLYYLFTIVFSLINNNSMRSFLFSLLVYPCLHYSYGVGMQIGYLKRIIKK